MIDIPAIFKVNIILGTVGGVAAVLSKIDSLAPLYLQGLRTEAVSALQKWPKIHLKEKKYFRYLKRQEAILERIEAALQGKWKDLPSVFNFLLALVIYLQEELGDSPRAKYLDNLIEMLEQYIETVGGTKDQYIDYGIQLAEIFEENLKE